MAFSLSSISTNDSPCDESFLRHFLQLRNFPPSFVEPKVSYHIYKNLLLVPTVSRIPSLHSHNTFF